MSHHTLHGLEKNTSLVAQSALAHRLQNDNIHKRAPILGNGILGPYTFMSSHKKNQNECYYVAGSERVPPGPVGYYFLETMQCMMRYLDCAL